jgi:hypothetical protein
VSTLDRHCHLRGNRIKARSAEPVRICGDADLEASVYDGIAQKLAGLFQENVKKCEAGVSAEIRAGVGMKMAVSGDHEHAS